MKARNKEELNARREKSPKRTLDRSSLVSRISSFYTKMFATWLFISLVVIFVLGLSFAAISLVYNINPYLDGIEGRKNLAEFKQEIESIKGGLFVLADSQGRILASSFPQVTEVRSAGFAGIEIIDNKVFFTHAREYLLEGMEFKLVIYSNITILLIEIAVIGGAAIFLFLISVLIIYVRGNYLTRKALGVLDELIEKASNISSQNLNLRLNVSDSTDELVEFALTFNRMMDRIEMAYGKQNQFVSDASHELRTPIAVIQGYARMLERWGKDDKEILQEAIQAIIKESKCMQDLVEKLLFIARNDKDTLVLVKENFSMSELIEELARETRMIETRYTIECRIQPGIEVNGDRDRIKQALRILIDNAIKYTEPGGKITLRIGMEDGFAVASVKDTGMGIPEENLPNIFDRFYRVDSSRERNKGGHGLGLSIARIIVLRHGGRIKVASKPGKGTRFSICLPQGKY